MPWQAFRQDFAKTNAAQGNTPCPSAVPIWFCGLVRAKPNANPTQARPTRTERYHIESRRAGRGSHEGHITLAAGIHQPGLHSFLAVLALHGFFSVTEPDSVNTYGTFRERAEIPGCLRSSPEQVAATRRRLAVRQSPPAAPVAFAMPTCNSGLSRSYSPAAKRYGFS